ncbi:glycosyltransferase involved in cell wall biosynthesis [Streptosporangium becharense]|uniref:Glycosyltransferase involved in cell wall biosynthesis n=1 Tax=Streptosporangium becharense TaxID=1816182 RepID=A0A7W9MJ02_9ACTN|nr:glycosyltransferase [Streptosporangium becharense]MBB2911632.1 glycosyltransferase involved in cell wall biosynthesis [Streptosporangium becharense]MBB5822550.1 glycosyltransferase involved in cell wall biosynthesis [Streptosporangium becharense]
MIKTLDVGGAEVLLVERLLAAPPGAKRYTVVCMRSSTDGLVRRLRQAGIAVVDLTACPPALRLPSLVRVVRRLRPDVLNVHSPLPASLLRPVSRFWRPRPALVSTVHNVRYRVPTMLLDRSTAWLDARTVAVSPQVARAFTGRGTRGLATRIHGVDVARQRLLAAEPERIRREWNVPDSAFLIVHVANFRPQKNHALLVEAAARVVRDDPRAVFLLAGSGPLHDETARRVAALRSDAVRFLGSVPDAARLIASADLLVLSSSYEGLPVVVMEALAAGVPVVSTAVGGVPDLVEDGRNGLLTTPGDAGALAEGILRAMRPEVHERLRRGARDGADLVDIGRTAAWFDSLYDEICP